MKRLLWIGGFSVLVFELMLLGSPAFGGGGVGKFGTGGTGAYANFSDSIVTHLFRGDTLESRTTALVLKGTFHAGDTLGILMDGNTKVGYIDTLGNVYGLAFRGYNGKAVRLTKNGSALDADTAFTVRDNGGTLLIWGDTLGGLYPISKITTDTVKAEVVATTAMSEWDVETILNVFFYSSGWTNTAIPWSMRNTVAGNECDYLLPFKKINGGKVILDSIISHFSLETLTDSLQIHSIKLDSLGGRTVTSLGKTAGTGTRATKRVAYAFPSSDTSAYLSGYQSGFNFISLTGLADTIFHFKTTLKYHTIP